MQLNNKCKNDEKISFNDYACGDGFYDAIASTKPKA